MYYKACTDTKIDEIITCSKDGVECCKGDLCNGAGFGPMIESGAASLHSMTVVTMCIVAFFAIVLPKMF